jgi:hypothetical protein
MIPRFYLISAIVWAIIAIIGFIMVILGSKSPWYFDVGQIVSLGGLIGSWLSVLNGATASGQKELLAGQKELLAAQKELIEGQRQMLETVRKQHEEIMAMLRQQSEEHREMLEVLRKLRAS